MADVKEKGTSYRKFSVLIPVLAMAVLEIRLLVTIFSQPRPEFNNRILSVGFVVDRLTLGMALPSLFGFLVSIILPII